jgi:N-acetylmuramoyl-L-alanine amidase
MRNTVAPLVALLLMLPQALVGQVPATPLTLVTLDGRKPLPTILFNNQELVALDDLAPLIGATLKEDASASSVTVALRGGTIVVSASAPTASVNGRAVMLPAPALRSNRRWLVPIEFLQLALPPVYDQRIQLRRQSRLVVIGDLRVPRVAARVEVAGPPTRVTLEITPPAAVTADQNGGRVLVRVDADALDVAPFTGGGLVQQLRPGDLPNTLVLTLAPGAGTARSAATSTDAAARLVLEVNPAGAQDALEPAAPRPAPPAEPPVDAASLLASRPPLQVVVLDPGHGGEDTGVKGPGGVEEKRVVFDIARRLRALLEMRLGIHVILTRDGDASPDAEVRAARANNAKADLFLSLHANASPSSRVSGAEVYYLLLGREGERARQDARRTGVTLPVAGGGTRILELIPWDLAQARHVDESAALAAMVASALAERVPVSTTPVRQAPLRVLEGLDMPAVLVEVAYLTNAADSKLAASETFRNSVAEGILSAVVQFRQRLEEETR